MKEDCFVKKINALKGVSSLAMTAPTFNPTIGVLL